MKAKIHPKWYQAKVTCACGNTFTVGATLPEFKVEVCSACHPFYTGQMKYLDVAGRVDAFRAKQEAAKTAKTKNIVSKTEKRKLKKQRKIEEELQRPDTLEQLRVQR